MGSPSHVAPTERMLSAHGVAGAHESVGIHEIARGGWSSRAPRVVIAGWVEEGKAGPGERRRWVAG